MIACAAIATASRVKARNVQMVRASCMAARSASPSVAATYVITSREARSISVRMISGTPARPACRIPGRSGRSRACSRRAARTTTATSADGRPELGDERAERGSGDAQPVERADAVDEHEVQHDVDQVARDRHHQRRAGVLQPAQDPGGRQHQQQRAPRRAGRGGGTSRPARPPARRGRRARRADRSGAARRAWPVPRSGWPARARRSPARAPRGCCRRPPGVRPTRWCRRRGRCTG